MSKHVQLVDVLVERIPPASELGFPEEVWFAQSLVTDELSAIASSREEALKELTRVIENVLSFELGRLPHATERLTGRHLRVTLPAMQFGHAVSMRVNLFVVTSPGPDEGKGPQGYMVRLPQVDTEFHIDELAQLELICGEWLRSTFPLGSRLTSLAPFAMPLTFEDNGVEVPRFELHTVEVNFRTAPVRLQDDEQDVSPTLAAVGDPLHQRLARKDAPRAFERNAEVSVLLDALADVGERSVLLIGAAGVGKTAIVQEAVRRMITNEAPPSLNGSAVWQISGGRIMAGMRFLGQWQERTLEVINDARESGALLFIEDLVELLETAGTEKHTEGIPGLMLPYIVSGELVVIAEVQPDQLARVERTHPAFLRALRRQPIEPLSPATTDKVLDRVSYRLGRQFGVRLAAPTRQRILELVSRFKGGAELPGPAVELAERMARTHRKHGVVADDEQRPLLLPAHAMQAYASYTGLPVALLDSDVNFDVGQVRDFFEGRVFAQPEAVTAMVDLVTCVRAGLNSPSRPLGSFLFLGPTGVGKTQTALTLTEYMFGSTDRLVRFDMSEYQDAWAAGRLVGRYRGERGDLVKRVQEQPFQVLLLDEIEKAHATVFDYLLQVLGEGRLTDGRGQTVSLTSAIIIMTSNLGAGGPSALGFSTGDAEAGRLAEVAHYRSAVEKFFRPEFVGRVDNVIPFRSLGSQTARQLVEHTLKQAFSREGLVRRRLRVSAADEVVQFLIRVGFDERYGARPLRRAVESHITAPLGQFVSRETGLEDLDLVFVMQDGLPVIELG